jgi:DNA (cytosine-5)-methyltransferase 1
MWFVKARRAQNQDDDETWKYGGVCTTLNAFDNGGESRATVLIVYAFDSLSSNSMKSKNPNSGSREITVAKTLDTTNGDPSKNQGGMAVLIIDGTRVGDVRVTDEETMQTVIQRWGTGGGNVPLVAYGVDSNENGWVEKMGTVTAGENSGGNQQVVAYSIREDATANNSSATEIEQARALQALQPSVQSHHAQTFITQPVAYDEYNNSLADTHHTLRAGTKQSTGVIEKLQVRRLTPMECERLQGFPDGWTQSQSDSQRYRQMGNAVTVNVIESIGQQLGRVSNG